MIPNIVHFMFFSGENARKFSYINYLAIKRASDVQQPDVIYLYYDHDFPDNRHWQSALQYVKPVKLTPPAILGGIKLIYPQYKADFVRLSQLYTSGGIYLDTDMILLKKLNPLMGHECVLGVESYVNHAIGSNTVDVEKVQSISNALIMAEPRSRFIDLWLERMPDALKRDIWAYHAVVLPMELYKENIDLVSLQPKQSFVPFDFRDDFIFRVGSEAVIEGLRRLEGAYSIHMWETIWSDRMCEIDDAYMENFNNTFTNLF